MAGEGDGGNERNIDDEGKKTIFSNFYLPSGGFTEQQMILPTKQRVLQSINYRSFKPGFH